MARISTEESAPTGTRWQIGYELLVHLRLHYQVLLAPIFLWGYLLAADTPDARFWLAFLAFHLFLYGGTTAFNSYYDRDEGPVGGLEKPPAVTSALLPFSLLMQSIGAILAALVNGPFLLIYLLIFGMATAYSHPSTRLKGRPLLGLITVGVGQGVLAALGGWVASGRSMGEMGAGDWIGILAVALITTGFYPVTQIYQVEEDRARGDLTFAAWVGAAATFRFALVTQGVAAVALLWCIASRFALWQAAIVALFYGTLLWATAQWAHNFDPAQVLANFRRVMRINMITSLGFLGFLGLHLVGWMGG